MSETPATQDPTDAPAPEETTGTVDYKAEAEKWKSLSRKNEDRARENAAKAKRLDEIEEQSKTDLQKAIDAQQAAEKRASELEVQVLRASIAAQKGVLPELLTGTTEEEITQAADRLIQWRGDATPKVPASTSSEVAGEIGDEVTGAKQLTRDDLKSMTSKQINEARKKGQLNTIMGVS